MNNIQTIVDSLQRDKRFAAPKELPQSIPRGVFSFIGHRECWGSIMTIGLVVADKLPRDSISDLSRAFYRYTSSLKEFAPALEMGISITKLGSFGLLCFLFENPVNPSIVDLIRGLKFGSVWRKDYYLCWSLDFGKGKVNSHRGFPFLMFPGRRYLERLLRNAKLDRPNNGMHR